MGAFLEAKEELFTRGLGAGSEKDPKRKGGVSEKPLSWEGNGPPTKVFGRHSARGGDRNSVRKNHRGLTLNRRGWRQARRGRFQRRDVSKRGRRGG